MPGTVVGSQLVYAPNLGWHEVDLSGLWPHYHPELPLIAGNDATCAAVAESRHGAGVGAGTMVYLHLDAGIGGAVVEGDRVVAGATGAAGGSAPCRSAIRPSAAGAGPWAAGTPPSTAEPWPGPWASRSRPTRSASPAGCSLPPAAPNRLPSRPSMAWPARSGGGPRAWSTRSIRTWWPWVGWAARLLEVAGGHATAAYDDGLMAFRTLPAPPLVAAHLPDDGSLLGAAELCFDRILTEEGLQAWALADCPA